MCRKGHNNFGSILPFGSGVEIDLSAKSCNESIYERDDINDHSNYKTELDTEVLNSDKPFLVDFWALGAALPPGYSSCRKLAEQYQGRLNCWHGKC